MESHDAHPDRRISEISHLFLSSVREKAGQGLPKPQRKPPGTFRKDVSIDLTPEEFAQMAGADDVAPTRPVTAVIASHLAPDQSKHVHEYALTYAARAGRVGLIEIDAAEVHISLVEATGSATDSTESPATVPIDSKLIGEVLSEMNCDVDEWLIALSSPRLSEPRDLLRAISRWVVLTTADHEGVVATYRMIKGLSDLPAPDGDYTPPTLSLAVTDAVAAEVDRVYRKLASVCQQFLGCGIDCEPGELHPDARLHPILHCRADKPTDGSHWKLMNAFVENASTERAPRKRSSTAIATEVVTPAMSAEDREDEEVVLKLTSDLDPAQATARAKMTPSIEAFESTKSRASHKTNETDATNESYASVASRASDAPVASNASVAPAAFDAPSMSIKPEILPEVIDLPASANDSSMGTPAAAPGAIARAVVSGDRSRVECPITPPMCPQALLCVTRERKLQLVAVATSGLKELRAIAQAYRWMNENRQLLSMAMPQMSIDQHTPAMLELLVDHADLTADVLQPLMESAHVTVKAYRKLRWNGRTGLLLEAA